MAWSWSAGESCAGDDLAEVGEQAGELPAGGGFGGGQGDAYADLGVFAAGVGADAGEDGAAVSGEVDQEGRRAVFAEVAAVVTGAPVGVWQVLVHRVPFRCSRRISFQMCRPMRMRRPVPSQRLQCR
ncbi:hypothetical protein Pen02_00400 [Plantactinospora endophytica]|uniref:Uncharacterized protein n=1 Tax=Plantactinospora endophytica TaxID=673535 RepID=A0ABQ4DRM1_9ACTN|nr:hypothetical protein Pen02_00400 [Plantactinospora endophytica]